MLAFLISGCYYDIEEELYPGEQMCDTLSVTYSSNIAPLIQNNCLQCHSIAANSGGVTLEGYTNLKAYADNGKLLGVIRHEAGFSPMPKNAPKLNDCDIAAIEKWISNGSPDN